jgi:hypothetical protein
VNEDAGVWATDSEEFPNPESAWAFERMIGATISSRKPFARLEIWEIGAGGGGATMVAPVQVGSMGELGVDISGMERILSTRGPFTFPSGWRDLRKVLVLVWMPDGATFGCLLRGPADCGEWYDARTFLFTLRPRFARFAARNEDWYAKVSVRRNVQFGRNGFIVTRDGRVGSTRSEQFPNPECAREFARIIGSVFPLMTPVRGVGALDAVSWRSPHVCACRWSWYLGIRAMLRCDRARLRA